MYYVSFSENVDFELEMVHGRGGILICWHGADGDGGWWAGVTGMVCWGCAVIKFAIFQRRET